LCDLFDSCIDLPEVYPLGDEDDDDNDIFNSLIDGQEDDDQDDDDDDNGLIGRSFPRQHRYDTRSRAPAIRCMSLTRVKTINQMRYWIDTRNDIFYELFIWIRQQNRIDMNVVMN